MSESSYSDLNLEPAIEKSQEDTPPRSTAWLDGLRGLAALLVYFSHHVAWWYGPDESFEHGFGYHGEYHFCTLPFVRLFFSGGSAAVAVFFVISGYVLSLTPLRMIHDRQDAREVRSYLLTAALRRPFRLYLPVAAISLIFAAWLHLPFGLAPQLQWPKPEPNLILEFWRFIREIARMMNVFAKHTITTPWFPYNPPVWTMAAELRGSLVLYGMIWATSMVKPRVRLLAFVVAAPCLLVAQQWELAGFLLGAVFATLEVEVDEVSSTLRTLKNHFAWYPILCLGLYLLGQPAGGLDPERSSATPGWQILTAVVPSSYRTNEFWRFWTLIGAGLVVFSLTQLSSLRGIFEKRIFRYLGKVSFSLYLVHIPIIWTVGDRIARAFGRHRFEFPTPFDDLLVLPDIGIVGVTTGFLAWQAGLLPLNLKVAESATRYIDETSTVIAKSIASWILKRIRKT